MTENQFKAFKARLTPDEAFLLEERACLMEEGSGYTREVSCEKAVAEYKKQKESERK
jgi:hypothetical protein